MRVSIHAPLARRDRDAVALIRLRLVVSIHAPLARRDRAGLPVRVDAEVSIHAPLARRDLSMDVGFQAKNVSIHAPLARRDGPLAMARHPGAVSIHAPLARRDHAARDTWALIEVSIHAPLARRDWRGHGGARRGHCVSIHAPLARRDATPSSSFAHYVVFQFTRLLRGATRDGAAEGGLRRFQFTRLLRGATIGCVPCSPACEFQFTRLLRGATRLRRWPSAAATVSIHAPLARRDPRPGRSPSRTSRFNSRASCEARPRRGRRARLHDAFQFTRLLRGATSAPEPPVPRCAVSIHAPLARRDTRPDASGST